MSDTSFRTAKRDYMSGSSFFNAPQEPYYELLGSNEENGVAADFTLSRPLLQLRDLGTPANNFYGDPPDQLTFKRSTVGYYFNAGGVLVRAAANVPRYEFHPVPGAARGLLLEESRVNICPRSEQFDNATWTKTGTSVTADQAVAPTGQTTAGLISGDGAASAHSIQTTTVSNV